MNTEWDTLYVLCRYLCMYLCRYLCIYFCRYLWSYPCRYLRGTKAKIERWMWYFVGINVGTFVGIYGVNHVSTQAEIEYWMRYFVGMYVTLKVSMKLTTANSFALLIPRLTATNNLLLWTVFHLPNGHVAKICEGPSNRKLFTIRTLILVCPVWPGADSINKSDIFQNIQRGNQVFGTLK